MIIRAPGHTDGVKTGYSVFATMTVISALHSVSGTRRTRFSKSEFSASRDPREITVKTQRNVTTTSTPRRLIPT